MRGLLQLVGAIAAVVYGATPAQAGDWPDRPVTLVVSYAAGSGDDALARILTPRLSQLLGRQVIVENVGGAGGMNGTNRVARASPDGYQFVLGNTGTFAANQTLYKQPLYDAATDFTPVALIAEQPMLLVARPDFPADNLQQFVAYVKANQAGLQFASGGTGSATHLACVLLNGAVGINATHIAYRAAALALQDVVAGRIDYVCPIPSTALGLIAGKQVKPIANLSRHRTPVLPNLPTAQEQGVANLDAYIWNGIFLPKDTPVAIVQKLHAAIVATLDTPSVRERIAGIGGSVVASDRRSPEYLRGFVDSEIKKWSAPIKTSGVSLD